MLFSLALCLSISLSLSERKTTGGFAAFLPSLHLILSIKDRVKCLEMGADAEETRMNMWLRTCEWFCLDGLSYLLTKRRQCESELSLFKVIKACTGIRARGLFEHHFQNYLPAQMSFLG